MFLGKLQPAEVLFHFAPLRGLGHRCASSISPCVALTLALAASKSAALSSARTLDEIPDFAYQDYSSAMPSALDTAVLRASNRTLERQGQPFFVRGVTYSPSPIGVDVSQAASAVDFFSSDKELTWRRDLPLMHAMGVNTVRVYTLELSGNHMAFLDFAHSLNITVLAGFPLHRDSVHLRNGAELQACSGG